MKWLSNKRFVKDLFNAVYDRESFVELAGDTFIINSNGFPYAKTVRDELQTVLGRPKGGQWELTLEKSGISNILLPPKSLEMSQKLVDRYIAGQDISTPTDHGIDIDYIYYAEKVHHARTRYGLPTETVTLLARLLLKFMYSTINDVDDANPRAIKSYRTNGWELTIKEFDVEELKTAINKNTGYRFPSGYLQSALAAKLRSDMSTLIETEPLIMDNRPIVDRLQPYVYNYIRKSQKASAQIRQVIKFYEQDRHEFELAERRAQIEILKNSIHIPEHLLFD